MVSDKDRSIALWRLSAMLRLNQDSKLWAIGLAVDKQAIRYAKQAGIEYDQVRNTVTGDDGSDDSDISAIMG